jgi:cytochrome c nitrite reductase small subunit
MDPQYDFWQQASHHIVATCVDCHLPHAFIPKYIAKAENGHHHSVAFTFQNFHKPIMIKNNNKVSSDESNFASGTRQPPTGIQ